MLKTFYPNCEAESAYALDYTGLYERGYRGIIFDIDNTLVPHGEPATAEAVVLFAQLRKLGFDMVVVSNNKEPRVKSFADAVQTKYIYKANKPSKKGYFSAMKRMGCIPENTIFVGDQLFTDVWGAKRSGIFSYLVKPIHPKEEIQIVLKRKLEAIVLFFYHRSIHKGDK